MGRQEVAPHGSSGLLADRMCPAMRHIVMPLVLGVWDGVYRIDGCNGRVRLVDYILPDEWELIVSSKQCPSIRAFGETAQDLPIVPFFEI